MERDPNRREVIKTVTVVIGGVVTALALPAKWTKPIVESIIVPAHAQFSLATTTTTTTSTSTFTTPLP
jgi:hypothetical protein